MDAAGPAPGAEAGRPAGEPARTDRRLGRLQDLTRLLGLISSSLDIDQVLGEIARAAARLMDAPVVGLWVADETARSLEVRAFSDDRLAETYPRRRVRSDEGLPGWVATHRRPADVPDVSADPRILAPEWFERHGLRSAYVVPIVHQDTLLGVLAMNGRAPFRLGPDDHELLDSFVAQAALAIRNARLYRSSEAGRTRLAALVEVTQGITRGLDLPAVLQGIAEAAAVVFEGEAGFRLLEGDELVWVASTPGAKDAMVVERLAVGQSVAGRVAATGQPHVVLDIAEEAWVLEVHRRAAGDRTAALMCLPVRSGPRVLGTLLVFRERGYRFDDEALRLGMSLADQAGIAIENARLYAEAETRRLEAEALTRVTSAITRSLDLDRMLGVVVEQVCRLLGTERAAFAAIEPAPGGERIRFVARRGLSPRFEEHMRPRHRRDGTTARAIATKRPAWSADLLDDPGLDLDPETRALVVAEGYRAAISVPVLAGERVIGVLAAYRDRPGPFAPREVELLQALAAQAAVAVENARLYAEAEQRRREAERIAALAHDVNSALDTPVILQRVAETARELCGADVARIALREPDGQALVFRYWAGTGAELDDHLRLEPGEGIGRRLAETGRPFRTERYEADPRITPADRAPAAARGIVAALAVPIRTAGRMDGAILVSNTTPRAFGEHHEAVLMQLAEQAAVAIRNAALLAQAERRRRAAESLASVSRILSQSLVVEDVARRVVGTIRGLLDAETAALFRIDADTGDLAALAFTRREPASSPPPFTAPAGTGMVGLAIREGRVVVTADILADARLQLAPDARARIEEWGVRAVLAAPLVAATGVIGALSIGDRLGRVFDDEAVRLAQAFANQAALALENARLYEEARGARDFLRSITEHSPDAIVTTDVRGRVTYWSPRAEELLGYGPAEVLGRPVAEYQRGGLEGARAAMRRLRQEGRVRDHEVDVRTRDGRWVQCRASLALLRDPAGAVIGTLAILQDASERKRLEAQFRQAQKMEAVGRLAGGVAHDFNNLLAVIMGHSDLIQVALGEGDPLAPDVLEIRRAAERAAGLTRQLLAFSRRQFLQPQVVDINDLVRNMASMLRRLIGEDVELDLRLGGETGRVAADPGHLEQVVMNLAVNARDAMPGGGRVTLETTEAVLDAAFVDQHPGSSPGPHVVLAVRDTGSGMTPDVLAHLFEPFFTTKEPGRGTGLGLSTVYGIVKQHRGYVDVESEPGRGSTFRIYLPRVDAETAAAAAAASPTPGPGGRETVLLVEDEDVLRELVRKVLGQRGYRVLAAGNGLAALALVDAHPGPLDLVLTDVIMPQMSGPELVARLRARQPGLRVLYVSGYTADALRSQAEPGAAFLAKPFAPDALLRKVREVLDAPRP